MSTGYIATGHVRHLAAWTANEPVPPGADVDAYRYGRYRAICGMPTRKSALTIYASELDLNRSVFNPPFRRQLDAAMRKPVCKACTKTAHELTTLAGSAS